MEKTEEAERTGCWTPPFVGAHVHDDASTASAWAAPYLKEIKKEQKVSLKRFLKRNLVDVGMSQCI